MLRREIGLKFGAGNLSQKTDLGTESTEPLKALYTQCLGPKPVAVFMTFPSSPNRKPLPSPMRGFEWTGSRATEAARLPPSPTARSLTTSSGPADPPASSPARCRARGQPAELPASPRLGKRVLPAWAPTLLEPRPLRLRLRPLESSRSAGSSTDPRGVGSRGGPDPDSPAASAPGRARRAPLNTELSKDGKKR